MNKNEKILVEMLKKSIELFSGETTIKVIPKPVVKPTTRKPRTEKSDKATI